MSTLGIVLAAGQSTRLPNKTLLPMKTWRPVIRSAIEFARTNSDEVCIVHNGGVVETFCRAITVLSDRPKLIHHLTPSGVVSSIRAATFGTGYNRYLITFGDNIYDMQESPEPYLATSFGLASMEYSWASIRRFNLCGPSAVQLDGWDGKHWTGRENNPEMKFAGWLNLSHAGMLELCKEDDLINGMNRAQVKPVECTAEWFDIGTEEAYSWYMRS